MRNCLERIAVWSLLVMLGFAAAVSAHADGPGFDLAGPKLAVTVTRNGTTLPIGEVPNLATGDVLSIKADFPPEQSAHYLMVAAFLRGSTNPPPEDWFYKSETWNRKDHDGLTLTVPDGAQQVMVFLAPATGGDFKTLVNAVRGRPGAFVRASQDLNQASLDRSRLDAYIAQVRAITANDPSKLKEVAPILGRSLDIKVDSKCFDKATEEIAPCLMQNQEGIILSDGHSTSIVQALTSGPAGDLAVQLSYTPQANYGAYSPYVQSVMDIARILDSLHTAQYQYIPALATMKDDEMALMLNTPPSFHNPKSVLVVALPAVEDPQPPPLHAVDPKQTYCAEKDSVALSIEGAPLVFSTGYAHDTVLKVQTKDGKTIDVPVKADAAKGGLVIPPNAVKPSDLGPSATGSLQGQWGFAKFEGPTFHLTNDITPHWELAEADHQALVVGREDVVHLQAGDSGCVESVMMKGTDGTDKKADWKAVKPNEIEVKLPLNEAKPGDFSLQVKDYGETTPQTLALHAFDEPGHLDSFIVHAGDPQATLKGTRLEETAKVVVNGVEFVPGKVTTNLGSEDLTMMAKDSKALADLKQGDATKADVYLKDGREIHLDTTIGASRPVVALIGKSINSDSGQHPPAQDRTAQQEGRIQLTNADELPEDAKLTFSIRAQKPTTITRDMTIQVATEDESQSTTLSAKDGSLTREDRSVAVGRLEPEKAFGNSAFGPLKFRVVENDTQGDWIPLATLVRLPTLQTLQCPEAADQPCTLTGSDLFLLDSVANDAAFKNPVQIEDGFPGQQVEVPHPVDGQLFVKLRDDPGVVNRTAFPGVGMARMRSVEPANRPIATGPAPNGPGQSGPGQNEPGQSELGQKQPAAAVVPAPAPPQAGEPANSPAAPASQQRTSPVAPAALPAAAAVGPTPKS